MEILAERKTKTVYRDNNKAIKLFIEDYPKSNILNEALNQARVEEGTDLNVPSLIAVTKINNRWALVSEHIEGTPLNKLMEEHPEKEDEYLNLFLLFFFSFYLLVCLALVLFLIICLIEHL